jgi:hypothetical protein
LRRTTFCTAIVLLFASASALPAAAAPASEGAAKPVVLAAVPAGAAPRPVDTAASELMRWLDANRSPGLGGVSVNEDGGSVTVYWKGAVPAALRKLAAGQVAPVTFKAAEFSAAELDREAARVADANPNLVASVGPLGDYSGLGVELDAAAKGATKADLRTGLTAAVPVTVTGTAQLRIATRDADSAPFWGSALIYAPSSSYACSTGVSVYAGATSYITTAQHCGTGPWYGFGSGYYVGAKGAASVALDTELLSGSSYNPRVYTGAWNSMSSISVYNAERPADGSGICASGGVTGETCSKVNVRGVNQYVNISGVGRVGPGFWMLSTGSVGGVQVGIIQGGDSGSAAYAYTSRSQASVRGLTVAVDNTFRTAQCGGNPAFSPHMTCSARAFAVNAVDALAGLGVRIKTAS